MKYFTIALMLIFTFSCTPEDTVFEMETWWQGHWQQIDDPSIIFSSGQRKVGGNEIVTPQFFISRNDSILQNFYFTDLEDFDHKKLFKLIKTNENTYIKIDENEDSNINLHGPVISIDELDIESQEYRRLPEGITPPMPDSILFDI